MGVERLGIRPVKSSAAPASVWLLLGCVSFAACGGSTAVATPTYDAGGPALPITPADDGGADASPTDGGDDGAPPVFADDGTATRTSCTASFGTGLTASHGRLDGVLVAVVTRGGADRCPADSTHVHLQVRMNGAAYDIAVNIDGYEGEIDAPMPGGAYAEGWHPMLLDYATDLNLHSTSFTRTGLDEVRARVQQQLTNANHISVFGTGYDDLGGAHLIHREIPSHDGALVLDPLSPTPHWLVFRFDQDTF